MRNMKEPDRRRRTVHHEKNAELEKTRRNSALSKRPSREFLCNIQNTIQGLLDQEDTNKDGTITVEDAGPKKYALSMHEGRIGWIEGTYSISTLLQELALSDINLRTVVIPEERINEDAMSRLTRLIKTCFWKNLRRTLDKNGLKVALIDTKIKLVEYYLYIPSHDVQACTYYRELESSLRAESFRMKTVKMSLDKSTQGGIYFEDTLSAREILCDSSPGLLALSIKRFKSGPEPFMSLKSPVRFGSWHNPIIPRNERIVAEEGPCPFYVPGGRFNEMYGWDSYFIAKGLIHTGELAEAMCIAENLRYQICYYNKILNANRSYYLFRSSPPFFSTLVDEIIEQLNADERDVHKKWIEQCIDAMIKEHKYFQKGYNEKLGLTRHVAGGKGIPMETEEGHFFSVLRRYVPGADKWGDEELNRYIERYNRGEEKNEVFEEYLMHDRAVRESGHDTSKRVDGRAGHLYTVDLNSLLYKTEMDILRRRDVPEIKEIAERRKKAINTILWKDNCYYDYNGETEELSTYKGATCLYPLFSEAADPEKAEILVENMDDLVGDGGIFVGTEESSRRKEGEMQRQWDHPYGWAPHQVIAWIGLGNYNYFKKAKSLALKWCTMVGKIFAQYNGIVTEKYNVEKGSHKVEAEYGNIGANIKHVPKEGFGWTNSSWLIGLELLKEEGRRELYVRIGLS